MEIRIKEIRLGRDNKLYVYFKHNLAENIGMLCFKMDHQEYLKEQWGEQPWHVTKKRNKRKYGKR